MILLNSTRNLIKEIHDISKNSKDHLLDSKYLIYLVVNYKNIAIRSLIEKPNLLVLDEPTQNLMFLSDGFLQISNSNF